MAKSKLKLLTTAGFLLALSGSAAMADKFTVSVVLWDKGADKPMATGMTVDAEGKMDMSMANMGVKLSIDKVRAGEVTFKVANHSKDVVHEFLVIPLKVGVPGPPIDQKEKRISEDGAGSLGEVAELDPGKAGTLTLDLTPGRYLLTCNLPGHYMNGMWTILTVE
jgi:uncharacterized cupredoxin-like copper-binding protein